MRARSPLKLWLTAGFVAVAAYGLGAASVAAAQRSDPLTAAEGDPVELARAVDRLGDAAVLAQLRDAAPEVREAAVAATPFLVGPEAALPDLAELAAGRHPTLAPAAAAALLAIADRLSAAGLERREVPHGALRSALERLDALAADGTARGDLRAVAQRVARQLRFALGAAPAR